VLQLPSVDVDGKWNESDKEALEWLIMNSFGGYMSMNYETTPNGMNVVNIC
jgi:hypothetical protein